MEKTIQKNTLTIGKEELITYYGLGAYTRLLECAKYLNKHGMNLTMLDDATLLKIIGVQSYE